MKIKRLDIFLILCVLVVVALWIRGFWLTEYLSLPQHNAANRAALLQIREAIPLGASHLETTSTYERHRSDGLRLLKISPTDWLIRMPLEWGSSDWNLRITFIDGKVTSVQVLTSDGPPPNGAPEDKRQ